MNKTRKDGLEFLRKKISKLPEGPIAVSKYYRAEEAWPKIPAWWHDIALKKIQDKKYKYIHLLCRHKKGKHFYYMRVPTLFIRKNLRFLKICIVNRKKVIRLHLSALTCCKFHDVRGVQKLSFQQFQK